MSTHHNTDKTIICWIKQCCSTSAILILDDYTRNFDRWDVNGGKEALEVASGNLGQAIDFLLMGRDGQADFLRSSWRANNDNGQNHNTADDETEQQKVDI